MGLPGSLGKVGLNPKYVREIPVVDKGMEGNRTCLYHNGSLQSFLSSVHLLPDTRTASVVLTNSMANNDAADWIGQLLFEVVIANPDKNDYVSIARDSAPELVAFWPRMARTLEERRIPNTKAQALSQYVGSYWNLIKNWHIDVFETRGALQMCFQNNKSHTYCLDRCNYKTITWLQTWDENVHQGRFPVTWPDFYLMEFVPQENSQAMAQLIWKHDADVPEGEVFYRHPPSSS